MGVFAFGVVLLMPTIIYFAGHTALRRYPKLFNTLHWLFGIYLVYVIIAGVHTLLMG
jgi:threonine/homoserine/homoserine lactone efflux protein